jgi:hypothetical protein
MFGNEIALPFASIFKMTLQSGPVRFLLEEDEMAMRTAVCHAFRVLAVGVLLLCAPLALQGQEKRTVTVGAEIVESANMLAIDAAKRLLADQPVSFFDLETTVVKDSPLFHVTVVFGPLKREQSTAAESEITATIHFPRN